MKKKTGLKTPSPTEAQNVTLRLRRQKVEALDELAERMGTTRSALIQMAIAEYLERSRK